MRLGFSSRRHQSGASLIEAIVSLLVLALGVMGMLSVQLKSMTDNQNANQRIIAARLADDLFERMRSNAGGIENINDYVMGRDSWPETNPEPAGASRCDVTFCIPNAQAAFDLWQWRDRVETMLTGGEATTFISPADERQLGVMIAWPIRKNDAAKTSTGGADVTKTNARYRWLNVDVVNGATCPLDKVCHVAYSQP